MFRSWKLGKLAGIDVLVHWSFLLLIGWVLVSGIAAGQGVTASLLNVLFVLTLFGCVVLHELGHALAARHFGIPTRDITLLPIGGVARLERMPTRPLQELAIAVAGPLVNVVIAAALFVGLSLTVGFKGLLHGGFLPNLLAVNVMLVLFNMLPAFPMDGGRVLRSLLAMRMDYVVATDWAAWAGQVMAVLFALAGLFLIQNPFLLLVAAFVFLGASAEARQVRLQGQLAPLSVGEVMQSQVQAVPGYLHVDQVAGALIHPVYPIVDETFRGLLWKEDVFAAVERDEGSRRISDLARTEVPTVQMSDSLLGVLQKYQSSPWRVLPVLHGERLAGLLALDQLPAQVLRTAAAQRPSNVRQQPVYPPGAVRIGG